MSRRQLTIFCCGPTTAKCTAMKVGTMEFKTPFSFFFFFSHDAQSKICSWLPFQLRSSCLYFSPDEFSYKRIES